MSVTQDLTRDNLSLNQVGWRFSPKWLLLLLAVLIFSAELIAMIILYYVKLSNYLVVAIVDGLIMLALISPGLYWMVLQPFRKYIEALKQADTALNASESRLSLVLEILPVGVWITDEQGLIRHGNRASQEIWAGARYVGIDQYYEYKGWWLDSGKQIEPQEWAAARAIMHLETSLNEEVEIECFDGSHKIILNSAIPFFDESQKLAGSVVVNQDISELKRAQRELEEREALFRTAFENLPVGIWLTDKTGKITYGNPAGQQIWAGARYVGMESYAENKGWRLDNGKSIEPDDWGVSRAINRGETSLNEEIEIECFDGTRKIILNSAIPVFDEKQRILWAFVVNQDITERKQWERALMQNNELLERFFASIGTLIAYMDRDFNFIRVNQAYAQSAGHTPDFFVGKNHFQLYPHAENEAIFRNVLETGEPYTVLEKPFEYAEYPDRGVTYWDWSVQPVKGQDAHVQGLILSLVDVTARKRAELQLAEQNQDLRLLTLAERRQRQLAEGLVYSTLALNSSLELEQVLASILEQLRRAVPFQGADIVLVDGNNLRVASFTGFESYPDSRQTLEKTFRMDDFPLFGQIETTLEPLIVEDTSLNPAWQIAPGMEWVRSYAAAPLVAGGKLIGIINLTSELPGFFDQQMIEQVTAFAPAAAVALRNAQSYKAERTAHHNAETLRTAALALAQTLDIDQVLQTLIEHINNIISTDISGVGLFDDEENVSVRVAFGFPIWTGPEFIFSLPPGLEYESLLGKIIRTRQTQLVNDTMLQPFNFTQPELEHFRNWLLVPIIVHEKAIGLVGLGKNEPGFFSEAHVQWVEALVSQAAIAIQNAWLFQQVRSSSERLQSLARKLVEVQENERYLISRELHDEAGQALSSLKLSLGRLEQDPDCSQSVRQRLEDLKDVVDSVLEGLHNLAVDLRPVALDHLGLVAALEQYAKNIHSDRIKVQFKALGFEGARLPVDIEINLYRIVQEALTNVIRHARASNVGILLERGQGKVILFVEDDGVGFDQNLPEANHRLGLVGMQERAEMIGGTLTIESSPGIGTSIIVEVPDASSNHHSG